MAREVRRFGAAWRRCKRPPVPPDRGALSELNLIYWGTGNPGPDWNGEVRRGDNLYSDSALAVDADTGKLAWYFQFTPWDVHDWDAIQIPVLTDLELNGEARKVMIGRTATPSTTPWIARRGSSR